MKKTPHQAASKQAHQTAFLAAFRETASITRAAELAGIGRRNHYDWLKEDPDYARAFEEAQQQAADVLEDEAIRRAHAGTLKPLSYQGQFTYPPLRNEDGTVKRDEEGRALFSDEPYAIREYSDSLLMFLLKGAKGDKYRERREVQHTGTVEIVERLTAARKRLQDAKG